MLDIFLLSFILILLIIFSAYFCLNKAKMKTKTYFLLLVLSIIISCFLENIVAETDFVPDDIQGLAKFQIQKETDINNRAIAMEEVVVEEIGIELNTDAVKKDYKLNEELDFTELLVTVLYNNGERKLLSKEEYTVSVADFTTYGTKELTVSYKEFTQSFQINVSYVVRDVESQAKYASTSLNMRSGPGTEFDVLTSIPLNTEVTVIGEVENGWVKVLYQNNEYFCSGQYLMNEKKVIVQPEVFSQAKVILDSTGPYDNKVVGEPGADINAVNQANHYWNEIIPNSIKQLLVDNGWQIFISGTDLTSRFGYKSKIAGKTRYAYYTDGSFVYGSGSIYIDNRVKDVDAAFVHEVGHAVDATHGRPSQYSEFVEIFEAEKSNFIDCTSIGDGHETSSAIEYFAAVFANILINGINCQEQVPRSYEFVSRYI